MVAAITRTRNREQANFSLALLGFLPYPFIPHASIVGESKTVRLNQGTGCQWSPWFFALRVTYYLLVRLSADS